MQGIKRDAAAAAALIAAGILIAAAVPSVPNPVEQSCVGSQIVLGAKGSTPLSSYVGLDAIWTSQSGLAGSQPVLNDAPTILDLSVVPAGDTVTIKLKNTATGATSAGSIKQKMPCSPRGRG